MNQTPDFTWDLYYRDDRFIVYRGRFEVIASLGLLGIAVGVAAVLFALGHHGARAVGIAVVFLVYSIGLVTALKMRGEWRAAALPAPLMSFVLAGSLSGAFVGLLLDQPLLFLTMSIASGILFGAVHWVLLSQLWKALNRFWARRLLGKRAV